ncbi:Zinc finger, BED-type predicted [Ceratobasidium sp. AG-Ba]|nr:Zinc finger, BED-type predicted [Ceratobasidium sp. AG-Ba]
MSYHHDSTTGEPLPKRLHIETSPSPDGSYTHRWSIPNRASLNNAADTLYFPSSRSLAYHFVNLIDPVETSPGELASRILQCGSRLDSEFDPDVFDHLVARWIVASKETFANSIENEEFQELIDLLRPGHKLRIDSIKEQVKDMTGSEHSQ